VCGRKTHRDRRRAIVALHVFEWGGQVPTKGLRQTQLIVLGAVLLYQLVLLYQFDQDRRLAQGIKPLLRAA